MNPEFNEEKLRSLLKALKDYSNAKIVELSSYMIQFPDAAVRNECLRVYCEAIEGLIVVSDAPKCLALFYVANEILQKGSDPEYWRSHLAPHLLSFLPRVCAVACQTQEWNVPVNIFRLPHVWRESQVFPAEFCEELSRHCRESYDDAMKAPSLPPLVIPSGAQEPGNIEDSQHGGHPPSPLSDAGRSAANRRQNRDTGGWGITSHAESHGVLSRHSSGSGAQVAVQRGSLARPLGQASHCALDVEKCMAASQRTQEAVQHIEDLKVKEIAYERMLLEERIKESAESLRSLHTSRLSQCRTHAETLQIQARNQAEMSAMEKEASDLMDTQLRAWDADLQRWRSTVHLAAAQLPPLEETYRAFYARLAALSPKPGPAAGRHDHVKISPRSEVGRAKPPVPSAGDGLWGQASRLGGETNEKGRYHPYGGGTLGSARPGALRELALRRAQVQLEQEGVLPADVRGGSFGDGKDDMDTTDTLMAQWKPSGRSGIPLGLPCSAAMTLLPPYRLKLERDTSVPPDTNCLVPAWNFVNAGCVPGGRVADLWCSQLLGGDPSLAAQMGPTAASQASTTNANSVLLCALPKWQHFDRDWQGWGGSTLEEVNDEVECESLELRPGMDQWDQ